MSEWKKVKIGDICKIVKGTTGIASAEPGQYPLVVTAEERKTCSTYQFDCEAVCIPLVSSSGHGKKSLKNVHYQSGKFALGTILCAVIPNNPQELDARYLHQYLQFYKDIILVPLMKGAANVSLSMKDIATVEFPLPPIERQRELSNLFVSLQEKQKELSAEYEKQTEYAKLLRQNILQQAIEGKLTADLPCRQAGWRNPNFRNLSGNTVPKISDKFFTYVLECDDGSLYKGFSQNLFERINRHLDGHGAEWTQRHKPIALIHFEELKTEKEAVEREKYFKSGSGREYINKIRNENKQNYDAEALFEKIQKERSKEKKQKELSPITDEDLPAGKAGKPFEIPEGWKWVRLGEISLLITDGEHYTPNRIDSYKGYYLLSARNIRNEGINLDDVDFVDKNEYERINKRCNPRRGDILISCSGSIGRSCVICDDNNYVMVRSAAMIRINNFNPTFICNSLQSIFLQKQIKDSILKSVQPNLFLGAIKNLYLPLPPLKEQEEIVNKVETLLAKVTTLENQIQDRKSLSDKLIFGIIKEAFMEN